MSLELIQSNHQDCINILDQLKDVKLTCDNYLGVKRLSILAGASPGCGGATLLTGVLQGHNVVIKVFPVDCPFKYINGRQRPNGNVRDYGQFELGTGLLLTDLFLTSGLTQNITTCYNMLVCNPAYPGETSLCTKQPLNKRDNYPVPTKQQCQDDPSHPLCFISSCYYDVQVNGMVEQPARHDELRFLVAEQCQGDLLGLIPLAKENLEEFDQLMSTILFMVMHTLILFDCKLDGYSHNDLGLRNILYVEDEHGKSFPSDQRSGLCETESHWRYLLPDVDGFTAYDIPSIAPIPKIWDFAFVVFGKAHEYSNYYDYLNTTPFVPNLEQIIGLTRQNDVYIALNDLDYQLRQIGITESVFNHLDLEVIKQKSNNTAAAYTYLQQIDYSYLLADDRNQVVHTFPSDLRVFDNFDDTRHIVKIN